MGDSAYIMKSYLLVPYNYAASKLLEDACNFLQSNCRIRIECTFGELVMRFRIFWRELRYDLTKVGNIINAAALLHNFTVDEREEEDKVVDTKLFQKFSREKMYEFDKDNHNTTNSTSRPIVSVAPATETNQESGRKRDRPKTVEQIPYIEGEKL